jgi:hypothetical protein
MHGYIHRNFLCMPNKIMEPVFLACCIVGKVHVIRNDCAEGGGVGMCRDDYGGGGG